MSLHERLMKRRAEAKRLLDEATERLIEVLSDYGVPAELNDSTREMAAYILGLEGDGDDDAD